MLFLALQPRQFLARFRKDLFVLLNQLLKMFFAFRSSLTELLLETVNGLLLPLDVPLFPCDFLVGLIHGVGMR